MMKKHILSLLFTCITSISFSQIHEIGFFVGGSNYVGDIGSTSYISPNSIAGGLIYKYNYNPRMAFRGTYSYLPTKGDDANASNPYREQRGISFTNTIHELAIGLEYNFFEYNISEHKTSFTPYILVEAAAFSYKKPERIDLNGNIILRNSISYALPFGIGIKGLLSGNLAYAVETKFRYALVDDIDYTGPYYAPNNAAINLDFGGTDNDWYMFTGISIVYTFGRPACYTDAR